MFTVCPNQGSMRSGRSTARVPGLALLASTGLHARVRSAVLLAFLVVAAPAMAGTRCAPGTFVVHAGPRLLDGATGTYDVVRLDGAGRTARVAIVATCPPV